MDLYPWQKECLKAWERNGFRGIVRAVTGAGKTKLALEAICRLRKLRPALRVKIVVPTIPLARQWQSALCQAAEEESQLPGFFGGGKRDDPDRLVMIYILNSARDSLSDHMRRELALDHPCLLISDECHHVQSPRNRRIFGFLTAEADSDSLYSCLGLSATPFGTDNDELLARCLGEEVFRYDYREAEADGVISPFLLGEVSVPFLPEEKVPYDAASMELGAARSKLLLERPELGRLQGAAFLRRVSAIARQADMDPEEPAAAYLLKSFQRKEISIRAQGRFQCALALLDSLAPTDHVLVFCERIDQLERLASMIRLRWGNRCSVYHSKLTQEARQRNLRDFRERRTRILVSCRCLDEGLDVPDANVGIVLSSTGVERQRLQRLGRILRTTPEKDFARLYYLYVKDSAEDGAYLPGSGGYGAFPLHFESIDRSFYEELYAFAAERVMLQAADQGYSEPQLKELRRCITEALPRGDHLLPPELLERYSHTAASRHEKNYWRAMQMLNASYNAGE